MKTSTLEDIQHLFSSQKEEILEDFFTLLRFPSVSAESPYQSHVIDCAHWLSEQIKGIGLQVETWETKGHPTLFASYLEAGPDRPTLLLYNHYDVQPVDPLEEWESPPFEPTIRDGEVYARGAQDNKGQLFYVFQALKFLMNRDGRLPINVKWIIEGEEECGSAGLSGILKERAEELTADYLAVVDVEIPGPGIPGVVLSVRGIMTTTLELYGSNTDLHSGSHGGMVYNPLHAMVELLSKLRDEEGRITLPGFYDDIQDLTEEERSEINFDFDEKGYENIFGCAPTGGEKAYGPQERQWIRPTLEINGITGGYGGDGFKTVIPAKAMAKLSCRLVPRQDPQKIHDSLELFLKQHLPPGIEMKLVPHHGGFALRSSPHGTHVQALAQAYSEVLEKPCRFILSGGSIPISSELGKAAGAEVVLLGYGLPTDKIHAPNEHFGVERLKQGMMTIARTLEILGE